MTQEVTEKIRKAIKSTGEITEIARQVTVGLDRLTRTNSYPILEAPEGAKDWLLRMAAALERASMIVGTTEWPTPDDYDEDDKTKG